MRKHADWTHLLRGGRLTRWKGKIASCAPHIAGVATLFFARALSLSAVACLVAAPALAADRYWDANATTPGYGGTGNWSLTAQTWSPSDDGVSGPYSAWNNSALDNAIFGGTAGTVTLDSPISANSLTFNVGGYTLSADTLILGGTTPTITTNSGTTTINSVIAGSSGLTKAGGGTLALNGINTFTGGINLNAGTINASSDAALGAASNNISTAAGTTVALSIVGAGTNRTVTIGDDGRLNLSGSGAGSALITGDGQVSVGVGVTMSNDASTYTGRTTFNGKNGVAWSYFTSIGNLGEASSLGAPTTVSDGTIVFAQSSQYSDNVVYLGDGDSSNRNWELYGAAAIIRNQGTGTLSITGDVFASGGSVFSAEGADIELLGTLSGGIYNFSGNAGRTITLGGANTYTGTTSIDTVTVRSAALADAGTDSSFGAGNGAISITNNGALSYTGTGGSSNRAWTIASGSILNDGSGALTLSGAVDLGTDATNSLTLGGTFAGVNTLSGVVSGTSDLISDGAGTWVLSGANTRTGAVIVDGGTLRAGNASAFGTITDLVVNGGTLDLNSHDLSTPTLEGTGGEIALGTALLTVDTAADTSYAGSITGSGGLVKAGKGTLTLSGANGYTGDTSLGGGGITLDFSAAGAPANNIIAADSTLNVMGGTLTLGGADNRANSQSFDGLNISAGSNRIVATSGAGGSMTVDFGAITRTGGLVDFALPADGDFLTSSTSLGGWATVNGSDYAKVIGGVITAFTAADYTNKDDAADWLTGDIISDAGGTADTPFFGTASGSPQLGGLKYTAAADSTVNIDPGQTLGIDGTIIVASSVGANDQTINGGLLTGGAGGGTLGILQNGGARFTIGSSIVDNGGATGFTKGGEGIVRLTGDNSYTGVTTLSGGELQITRLANAESASSIGAASADASELVLESGTLHYVGGADSSTDRGFTLVNGGASAPAIQVDAGRTIEFSGLVTSPDDAGLTKTGWGTLVLSNATNDYVGVTTVTGGGASTSSSTLSVNTLADGGVASGIGAASSDSSNLILSDGGRLQYTGGTVDIDRGFTLAAGKGRIDVAQAATTLTIGGTAVGTGRFVKEGAGTLILSGTNSYTGGTLVNAGTLVAGSVRAFGGGEGGTGVGSLTVNSGATVDLADNSVFVGGLSGAGSVLLDDATLNINSGATFSGTISGAGGISVTRYTQTMTGCNNTYTGVTSITSAVSVDCLADGGQVSGIGAASSDPANLLIDGTLSYTGSSVTIDRGFTTTGGQIAVTDAGATLEFTGATTGGGFTKDGKGTLVLSGASTRNGTTQIDDGTLRAGTINAFGSERINIANAADATLDLNGFDASVRYLSGGGAAGGNVLLGGATFTFTAISSGTGEFGGTIREDGAIVKGGTYIQVFGGCASDYNGSTTINGGVLAVDCLADGGSASSIGASGADAGNLILDGGALRYIGTGGATDRRFTLGASAGNALDASGSGAIEFTSTGPITFAVADSAQALTLTGTNTGDNILAAEITNNGSGETTLTKTGAGTWILTNPDSTYTGITTISGGVLGVDKLADGGQASSLGASSADASNLVIGNNSTLRYTGAGDTTNRLFTLSAGTTFLESSGTGAIVFTDTGPVTLAGDNQGRTIALGGTNTGDNTLAGSIGDAGTGVTILAKNDAGTWVLTGDNTYTGNTVINGGTLVLGNGGTTGSIVSDTIDQGTLAFNRSDAYTYGGVISDTGAVVQRGTGTTILTADNTYTGETSVFGGTLRINGDQSAATGLVSVTTGATLGGSGIIGGDVAVAGGTLAPGNSPGTLTIKGDLSFDAGSTLAMQFGQADTVGGALNDLIKVGGDLVLDGTLNVSETAGGNYGPGVYRIISYGGTLTDNGLDIGTLPSGSASIQTSVTGQVNLLAGDGSFSFWDGDAGPKDNGVINGGSGTWQNSAGNDNWTESSGHVNAAYADDTFAVFEGTGGTVTIDDGPGVVRASGMQFASDGYLITGDDLELTGPQSTVRVGDGTAAGAGMMAIIASNLTGASQLVKTDDGTLVLSGTNSYTDGTAIHGGTLRISSDANLGDAAGNISINGGTLQTTADLTSGRAVTLDGAGTLLTDSGTTLALSGAITGVGALTKDGAGALVLTGDATQDGGTTIAAGTLQVGNGGTAGSLAGDVLDNAALIFNRSDDTTFAGNVSGTGEVRQTGGGTLRMTGDSTYTGVTTVTDAELRIEGGGTVSQTGGTTLSGSSATLTVTGAGSALTTRTLAFATGAGDPTIVNVEDGGHMAVTGATQVNVGNSAGNESTVNVTGAGSLFEVDGSVVVSLSSSATGSVRVTDGGEVQSGGLRVGPTSVALSTGSATVMVSGADSQWTSTGLLLAEGSLSILDGGSFTSSGSMTPLGTTGAGGQVLVSGLGSRFTLAGDANLGTTVFGGTSAAGVLTVADGARADISGDVMLGNAPDGTGILNIGGAEGDAAAGAGTFHAASLVFGPGVGWINFNHTDTDYQFATPISGIGTINQVAGVTVLTGDSSGFNGTTAVSGGALYVGNALGGDVSVSTGGVLGGTGMIGGTVTVAGGAINPGDLGAVPGTLTINGNLSLDGSSTLDYDFGQANVVGGAFNDLIETGGDLVLDGTLDVQTVPGASFDPGVYRVISYDGALTDHGLAVGTIPSPNFYVQTSVDHQVNLVNTAGMTLRYWDGATAASKNNGTIEGGDGAWQAAAGGTGNDNWTDESATANAPFDDAAFAVFMGAAGTVSVDDSLGPVDVSGMQFVTDGYVVAGDAINLVGVPDSVIRVGDGTTAGASTTATISAVLDGTGRLLKSDVGTLILTGNNTYTGGTAVNAGTLFVNGDQSAATGVTSVASGATLGGTGVIGGDVDIANGGTLAPGNGPGTLTVNGNLDLSSGSVLAYQFGQADVAGGTLNDLVDVGGDLTLDGTINVTVPSGGSFGPGVYRVFNYGGTLTDNGLVLGTLPSGNVTVQTAVAGQVNLVDATGATFNFWDGDAGPKSDDVINGGNGTWLAGGGNDNWTDSAGTVNAGYEDGTFAIFEGTPGTVTVDNSLGPVTAKGMQFASDGYTLAGNEIVLTGPQSTLRVGDGSTAGAGMTVTIESTLAGATQVVKTDAGTLVLTGTNTYSGGTKIAGGTVVITDDANLGDTAGAITFDGGTLATRSDLASARSLVLAGEGTVDTAQDTTFTYRGVISGNGELTKRGTGTLLLAGDSGKHVAASHVAAGTLAVDGALGGPVDVASAGTLAGNGQVGAVTNAGTVAPGRGGIGTLRVAAYDGDGGVLAIDSTLGGDASPTDLLKVEGDTSGTGTVVVTNRGGRGAQTHNGIKIIDVTGKSDARFTLRGDYTLQGAPAIVAGAYAYRLYQGGTDSPDDGDWYLRSALRSAGDPTEPPPPLYQPGAPIYESQASVLQQFNALGTLQQRVGNRMWRDSGRTQRQRGGSGTGSWIKVDASHARFRPRVSTSRESHDADIRKVRMGYDGVMGTTGAGRLVLGTYLQYGSFSSEVRSPSGRGSIEGDAAGLGTTLTWYGRQGFYVDGQAQITHYRSDLRSRTAKRELAPDVSATGYGLSVEIGQRLGVGTQWSLVPQGQLAYSSVRLGSFRDVFDTRVDSDDSQRVVGRAGIALSRDVQRGEAAERRQLHWYGIVNLYYDAGAGSRVDVAHTRFTSKRERMYAGVGTGGTYSWSGNKYAIYGEAQWKVGLKHSGDNRELVGTVGFRVRW